jgi:hypothetical protein
MDRTLIRSQVGAIVSDWGVLVILHLVISVWISVQDPSSQTHRLLESGRSLIKCSAIQAMIEVRIGRVSRLKGLEGVSNWKLILIWLLFW